MKNDIFEYKSLDAILNRICSKNKNYTTLDLLISLEKDYYEGEFFLLLLKSLKNLIEKQSPQINISTIRFDVGDVLNRHNLYYKYITEFIHKNNLDSYNQVSKKICDKFHKESFIYGEEQGGDWFKNNIKAINQLIPKNFKLNKDFKIGSGITTLYKGDKNNPKIEYISHKYWLNHIKYKKIEKELKKIYEEENSSFKRAVDYEAEYFYKRIQKRKNINDKEFFIQQTIKYILDETVLTIIKKFQNPNIIEAYYGGRELLTSLYFKGKKRKNNPKIKKLMEKGQVLEGANKGNYITIQKKEAK